MLKMIYIQELIYTKDLMTFAFITLYLNINLFYLRYIFNFNFFNFIISRIKIILIMGIGDWAQSPISNIYY